MRSDQRGYSGRRFESSPRKRARFFAPAIFALLLAPPAFGQSKGAIASGAIPERNILVLEDDFAKLIKYILDKNEGVLSTGSEERTLRQIAEAARIQARTSILLLRQNNEIIRLLKQIARKR